MMLYVRAEREGDWPLHLEAVKLMMSYFFASGHVNYARYGLFYLRRMETLPGDALQHSMKGSQSPLIMESPIRDRSVIDIHATVDRHRDIIPSMLAGHSLTGCDTVGAHFGVGKGTLLELRNIRLRPLEHQNNLKLNRLETSPADMADVMKDATALITCYGQPKATTLSNARLNVWTTRVGKARATNNMVSRQRPNECDLRFLTDVVQLITVLNSMDIIRICFAIKEKPHIPKLKQCIDH